MIIFWSHLATIHARRPLFLSFFCACCCWCLVLRIHESVINVNIIIKCEQYSNESPIIIMTLFLSSVFTCFVSITYCVHCCCWWWFSKSSNIFFCVHYIDIIIYVRSFIKMACIKNRRRSINCVVVSYSFVRSFSYGIWVVVTFVVISLNAQNGAMDYGLSACTHTVCC